MTLTLLLTIFFINCQQPDDLTTDQVIEVIKPLYQERMVSLSEIPLIKAAINNTNRSILNKTGGVDEAIFDYENILEVLDTFNNANYSFRFRYLDTPIGEFYNLVIGKSAEGDMSVPLVFKYKCDEAQLETYIANGLEFSSFKGDVSLHKYTDFFDLNAFNRGGDPCPPEFDEVGDPISCQTQPVDGTVTTGGNTTGNGTGGPTSGGGGFVEICVTLTVEVLCTCEQHHVGEPCTCGSAVGIGTAAYYDEMDFCFREWQRMASRGTEDCPGCAIESPGGVGVNSLTLSDMQATLKKKLTNLSFAGRSYILDESNFIDIMDAYFYLELFKGPNDIYTDLAINTASLRIELAVDPLKMIEIDCNQIQQWQDLVQHTIPQSVQAKMESVDENVSSLWLDVDLQTLFDAKGSVINLDYFPVVIDVLPTNPDTGQQFTANEFMDYIRININDFIDTNFTEFHTSGVTGFDENALWTSNNPLGTILSLDIPGGHDGSVIVSDYNNTNASGDIDHWIVSTITMPYDLLIQGYDGWHPVSGNREWGYNQNTDGSYTFFTRGVDRFESKIDYAIASYLEEGNPFTGADNLWTSFQQGIQDFTNNNGGVGNAMPQVINRPDWTDVKDVLLGNKPISDLGCD